MINRSRGDLCVFTGGLRRPCSSHLAEVGVDVRLCVCRLPGGEWDTLAVHQTQEGPNVPV